MIKTISIVIPSLGATDNLKRVVDSIRAQDIASENIEVLIVLNGVAESAAVQLRILFGSCAFPLVVETLPEKNVNKARNRGIELAQNEVLLFLDDDCALPGRHFLTQHLNSHARKVDVFALGGGYALPGGAGFLDHIYNYLQMRWLTLGSLSGSAQFLLGGNFSVKKSMLTAAALRFDETIAYGGSEFEFFVKAHRKGLKMEADLPEVLHHTRESLKGLTRKNYLQGRGAAIIDRKYPDRNPVGGSSITDPAQSFISNVLFLYLNYIFWAGYHAHERKTHKLIFRIFGDAFRAANFYRYEILKKISKIISEKDRHS
jgi:glycosyltransferase involved in cell wall biosynthesis